MNRSLSLALNPSGGLNLTVVEPPAEAEPLCSGGLETPVIDQVTGDDEPLPLVGADHYGSPFRVEQEARLPHRQIPEPRRDSSPRSKRAIQAPVPVQPYEDEKPPMPPLRLRGRAWKQLGAEHRPAQQGVSSRVDRQRVQIAVRSARRDGDSVPAVPIRPIKPAVGVESRDEDPRRFFGEVPRSCEAERRDRSRRIYRGCVERLLERPPAPKDARAAPSALISASPSEPSLLGQGPRPEE